MDLAQWRLNPEQLTAPVDTTRLQFASTEELPDLDKMIGQDRAIESIRFGVEISSSGYNLYALGAPGSGRTTAVRYELEQRARSQPRADDWCYVNNFKDRYRPVAIRLPAGKGREFRNDIKELIDELRRQIPQAFEGEHYRSQREGLNQELREVQSRQLSELREKAKEKGFALQPTDNMFGIVPLVNGEPIGPDDYEKLSEEERRRIEQNGHELRESIAASVKQVREKEKEVKNKVAELNRRVAQFAVGHLIDELRSKYRDHERVVEFLNAVQADIVQNVNEFLQAARGEQQPLPIPVPAPPEENFHARYQVNLLVDNADLDGAPIVFESNPTYTNLMGRIEHKVHFGALFTDFTMIKPGALHRANGGYLVVEARDLLTSFLSYDALKRSLKHNRIKIEEAAEMFRLVSTVTLEPEPIPLDVKVVIIGTPYIYYLLYELDEDFRKLFKVKADFDPLVDRGTSTDMEYACFIGQRCRDEGLKHFDPGAVAEVLRYSSRLVEDQRKLTGRLLEINDIVREASHWATSGGNSIVHAEDVKRAIQHKEYRSNRIEQRIREMIDDGTIMIDTDGEAVGQVNGIAVLQLGDYTFGKPSRITARTYMGKGGVVNIEREVKMSGRIHNKGVLILSGYLAGRFARERPLSIGASITFEQLYEGVEGDSASSAELYCLLSSLSGIPIRQGIAVTGSVNQHGRIQPVGGVTHKVEGFYHTCKAMGLTGKQGVIIPKANEQNLVLKDEVIDAVREGAFHVYAVSTIEEGIAILTSVEAGKRRDDGTYPEGTVFAAVDNALRQMTDNWIKLGKSMEKAPDTDVE